jgi:S-adenosylmethionine-diacylgycerolhomoserine-N-methlytransferase
LAQDLSPAVFKLQQPFDRIIFSYALSIMDDWRAALDQGLQQLKPGGTLHIVDFGDQAGLPGWFKTLLGAWLARFHVRFRPEVRSGIEAWTQAGRGRMTFRPVLRGYAYRLDFVKAAAGTPLDLPIMGNPT